MSLLSIKNAGKYFFGVSVLRNVSFDIETASVHGLIGENGAGKSTLSNIISGLLKRDEGDIFFEGEKIDFTHPTDSEKKGIVHIHQELNIFPELTVMENLFLGREIHRHGILRKAEMETRAKEIFENLGQDIDIHQKAGEMSIGHQQMVEIAKTFLHDEVKLIILDEPTAALTEREVEKLFELIELLQKERKVSFIYVSHRMEEMFRICDVITVLRDGDCIATVPTDRTTLNEIVEMMIGRTVDGHYLERAQKEEDTGKVLLQVENIGVHNKFKNISFTLREGEILGFSGLIGAGRTDVMNAIYGIRTIDEGSIVFDGEEYSRSRPSHSIRKGMGYLSEDRKAYGIFDNLDVSENIIVSNYNSISRYGVISRSSEYKTVQTLIDKLGVKTPSPNHSILSLSGGNQQKTLFARLLNFKLKVLILDEPTRGVDVGAKQEIYRIMQDLTEQGIGIVVVSSDLPEIIGVSDRIAVMHEGSLVKIVAHKDATQEYIMHLSTNTNTPNKENNY